MPKTEADPLGFQLKWRLRAELDRVRPRYSPPRYLSPVRNSVAVWRIAPAALATAIVGMLGLTAFAATGSPNPVVWTQQIVTRLEPTAAPVPNDETQSPTPSSQPAPAAPAPPTHQVQPTEQAEPSEEPHATPAPEPGSGGDGGGDDHSPVTSPSPSPSSGDR